MGPVNVFSFIQLSNFRKEKLSHASLAKINLARCLLFCIHTVSPFFCLFFL